MAPASPARVRSAGDPDSIFAGQTDGTASAPMTGPSDFRRSSRSNVSRGRRPGSKLTLDLRHGPPFGQPATDSPFPSSSPLADRAARPPDGRLETAAVPRQAGLISERSGPLPCPTGHGPGPAGSKWATWRLYLHCDRWVALLPRPRNVPAGTNHFDRRPPRMIDAIPSTRGT